MTCTKCVMDNSAQEITFEDGVCNFCRRAEQSLLEIYKEKHKLPEIIRSIKGKKYDCLIGLSGGVDSSTVLHWAVKFGLKPLCFSVDNGYNNPLADENILRMVEKLKVPFYRYTIDLDRFKDLQVAFMKAGQKNLEIPTDHILMATSYEMASKYGIKWILSGGNVATESIMPESWGYQPRDLVHIKDVYKKEMGKKLKGLPVCGLLKYNYYKWIKGIKTFYLLDYFDKYDRQKSIELLEKEYGWKNYGSKHEENYFTSWFQNFYLFEKFGIDKRKAHLSSLIMSGQITRDEALKELQKCPVYPEFGIENTVLKYPKREYNYYKNDLKIWNLLGTFIRMLRGLYRKLTRTGNNTQD